MQIHHGFLLSRHSRDLSTGTELIFWVKTPSGPAKLKIDMVCSLFFVRKKEEKKVVTLLQSHNIPFNMKQLDLRDFDQSIVTGFYFKQISIHQRACSLLRANHIEPLESDIRLVDRFLMERFVYGGISFIGNPISRQNFTEYHQVKIRKSSFYCSLSRVSLDIECSEKGVLYSIGLASDMDNRVFMINEERNIPLDTPPFITWVESEYALLDALNQWMSYFDPDVITGWNVVDFDFRLLCKRATVLGIPLRLGRGNTLIQWRESTTSRQSFITIPGRVVIDCLDALKTATYSFRSWSLDFVSTTLLGEGKSINSSVDKMGEINRLFNKDKISLAKYNLKDCQLVNAILDKTQLLDFLIQRSCLTGVELDRVGGSVAAFTNLYLPWLHRAGYVAPTLSSKQWQPSPGGYVMASKPGLYHSVLVLDYKSLYPSIIRTFLIDPVGLIDGLMCKDEFQVVEGYKGGVFHKTRHFLPQLITNLWQARDQAKKQGKRAFSQAIKIIMNSFYGVLGSSGCRFFDQRLASSITMRGHDIMKQTKFLIQEEGFDVIYGDTDSTFVALGSQYQPEEADRIGESLVSKINQWWANYTKSTYGLPSYLELEYETHYRRFLMPTIRGQETGSKKRYAGLIDDGTKKKLVFKGLETVRTDWTALAQEFQQHLYERIFEDRDVTLYVERVVNDTLKGINDSKLIYRKRLRRTLDEYQKNVPPHVRAARKADEWLRRNGKAMRYQKGGWIEYVITVNGPEPVECQVSPLDHLHYVNKQLKPIAEGILPFINLSFDQLITPQTSFEFQIISRPANK